MIKYDLDYNPCCEIGFSEYSSARCNGHKCKSKEHCQLYVNYMTMSAGLTMSILGGPSSDMCQHYEMSVQKKLEMLDEKS